MKLSNREILYFNAFQSIVGVDAKDCIVEKNRICFVVKDNDMGKAIGRKGEKIKQLGKKLNKQIELYGFDANPEKFLKKAFDGIQFNGTELKQKEDKKFLELSCDAENKSKLLNNSVKFRRVKELMKRNHNIEDVRIR